MKTTTPMPLQAAKQPTMAAEWHSTTRNAAGRWSGQPLVGRISSQGHAAIDMELDPIDKASRIGG